jgi:hypothetical protein
METIVFSSSSVAARHTGLIFYSALAASARRPTWVMTPNLPITVIISQLYAQNCSSVEAHF